MTSTLFLNVAPHEQEDAFMLVKVTATLQETFAQTECAQTRRDSSSDSLGRQVVQAERSHSQEG